MPFFQTSQSPATVLLTSVGLGAAGLSTGLALSYPLIINQHFTTPVQTPGTKPLTTAQRLSIWWHSYWSGYCVPAAALTSSLSLGALYGMHRNATAPSFLNAQNWRILTTAIVGQVSIMPFTLGFIMPINKRLYSLLESANKGVPVDDSEVDGLFQQWTRLHLVRVSSLAVACASAVLAFTL